MPTLRISEAFELYRLDYIVMSNQSSNTEDAYKNTSLLLIRLLGDIDIQDMTFEMVRDWRNWLAEWQKSNTVRGNVICLRMVLRFLGKREYTVLYYDSIPVAKRVDSPIYWLTENEVREFIAEAAVKRRGYPESNRRRNVALIYLLWVTGLRNNELCSLNRNTIRNRSFTISGKSADERIGFIDEAAEELIDNYLDIRTDSNPALFISAQTGNRITDDTLREIFRKICARSDFENVHPHTIRHSYGTHLLSKDVNLRFIADLMGHRDMNTTRRYTHYVNPQLKAVYEKVHGK